jgi:hypothetical protein
MRPVTLKMARMALALSVVLAGCSSFPSRAVDPYPGSGGLIMGTPSNADVDSGRAVFTEGKLDFAIVGKTTKSEVVTHLGRPAWWRTEKDGSSMMGYDFVEETPIIWGFRRVVRASFTFDKAMVLTRVDPPLVNEPLRTW